MSVPKKDSLLVPYATNFNDRIVASPTTYGLTAADATAYTPLFDAYISAWDALAAARNSGTQSRTLAATKNQAREELLRLTREYYADVQSSLTVLPADKIALGVVVRKTTTTPIPAPAFPPTIDIVYVSGRTVRIRLHDSEDSTRRGKPIGVDGANVFSFVGATPPASADNWKFEGGTGKTTVDITFPADLAPGTLVWICSFWFNDRKEAGPACNPVSVNLAGGNSMAL